MSRLQSMTGFSRAAGSHAGTAFAWEVKSVNGRGLEARFRLPQGFERLEQPGRKALQERFSRGNIQAGLTVTHDVTAKKMAVDEELLIELAGLATRLSERFNLAPASADGLLGLRGVMEFPDPVSNGESREALDAAIIASLHEALQGLSAAREQEGAALGKLLFEHVAAIEKLTQEAEADPSRTTEAIRTRLAEQLSRLVEVGEGFDEARLHTEAAYLATKADIDEELDRLRAHLAAVRSLLDTGGPIGRKLDFLSQEFNREANTLCSKSNAASVTTIGLEMKATIDRFREQVQNVE